MLSNAPIITVTVTRAGNLSFKTKRIKVGFHSLLIYITFRLTERGRFSALNFSADDKGGVDRLISGKPHKVEQNDSLNYSIIAPLLKDFIFMKKVPKMSDDSIINRREIISINRLRTQCVKLTEKTKFYSSR